MAGRHLGEVHLHGDSFAVPNDDQLEGNLTPRALIEADGTLGDCGTRALITPNVKVHFKPKGLPIAITNWPNLVGDGEPAEMASGSESALIRMTARSLTGSHRY